MHRLHITTQSGHKFTLSAYTADELESIKKKVFADGHYITKLEELKEKKVVKTLKPDRLIYVTKVFQTLTASSIPLLKGIKIEADESGNKQIKEFLFNLYYKLESGVGLSQALATSGFNFTTFYLGMVAAGEKAGKLPEVFSLLHKYLKRSSSLRKDLIQAMIYPVTILCIAAVVFVFIINFVVPSFADLYESFGGKLPAVTRLVLNVFLHIKGSFTIYISAFILFLVLCFLSFRTKPVLGKITAFLYRLPLISTILSDFFLYKFLKIFSIQISGGLTVPESLDKISGIYDNPFYRDYLNGISTQVSSGHSLSSSMSSTIRNSRAIEYIRLGEEAGKLPDFLAEAADYYEERVVERTAFLKELLQPMVIAIVGILIGFILISLFLPVFTAVDIIGIG